MSRLTPQNLLGREIERMPPRRVWVSGVCDPYQPLERTYELTRKCLEILGRHDWPIAIQTKQALVLRDVKLLKGNSKIEVGLTVTAGNKLVREFFEPSAPSISERIKALKELRLAGVRTYAMIGPMLPEVEDLVTKLIGKVDYVLIDRNELP